MTEAKDKLWFRTKTWTTANKEVLMLKNMDTSHLQNVIGFLRKRTTEELEEHIESESRIESELATLKTYREQIQNLQGEGVAVLDVAIKQKQEKLNNTDLVTSKHVEEELKKNQIYQAINLELQYRVQDYKTQSDASQVSFIEEKLSAEVVGIQENPEEIPMNISIQTTPEESKQIQPGDYCGFNIDCFRITNLSKSQSQNITVIHLVINARSQNFKEVVLSKIKKGDTIKIY